MRSGFGVSTSRVAPWSVGSASFSSSLSRSYGCGIGSCWLSMPMNFSCVHRSSPTLMPCWLRWNLIGSQASEPRSWNSPLPPQISNLEDPWSPSDLSDLLPLARGLGGHPPIGFHSVLSRGCHRGSLHHDSFQGSLYRHWRHWIIGSHQTRLAPDRRILLSLAHFKFTHDLYRRTYMAIELQSHSQASRKYRCYASLLWRRSLSGCGIAGVASRFASRNG